MQRRVGSADLQNDEGGRERREGVGVGDRKRMRDGGKKAEKHGRKEESANEEEEEMESCERRGE